MATAKLSALGKQIRFQGGLARTLVRTLMIFTFIPLTLMGGAAYLRARTLLRQQVIAQMQTSMTTQLKQVELGIKTKEIRLDRLVRRPDFAAEMELALQTSRQTGEFATLRQAIQNEIRSLGQEEGRATFNQFILLRPDGVIQMSSRADWEGLSLKDTPYYETLRTGDRQSFAIFDIAPLYPNELDLLTVVQYRASGDVARATIIGITESQNLQSILQGLLDLNPTGEAYFVTQNAAFVGTDPYTAQLAVSTPSEIQKARLKTALDGLMNTSNPRPESVEFRDSKGQQILAQVLWLDSLHAGVVFQIEQSVIVGQLNSLLPFTLLIFIIALLAMAGVISLGTNRVFKPIVDLTAITGRFAEGDFSQRAEARSQDEIGLLAQSFNRMADDLSGLYRSLEQKVEERTRQIRIAAEVAQRITASSNIDELLNRTVELIVNEFSFYHASVFMLDRGGKFAILRAAHGPAAESLLQKGHRLEVGSASIIGWVTANNQPRIASDVAEDPIHLKNELLPETRSEAGVPIAVGGLVLGALDVQSSQAAAFSSETMVMLQTLASQIAVAIQNVGLVESAQVNFQELERLYRASRQIAAAQTRENVLRAAGRVLQESPYPAAVFSINGKKLEVAAVTDPDEASGVETALPSLEAGLDEIQRFLSGSPVIADERSQNLPAVLTRYPRHMGYQSAAFLPISMGNQLAALIILGGRKQTLNSAIVQPYASMSDLISTTLEKLAEAGQKEQRLTEREALASINEAVAGVGNLKNFYATLQRQVQQVIGDFAFVVALYDKLNQTINIPYTYEGGRVDSIESFPLGEGLTSILIRTRQPLMLVENTEQRALQLGAKLVGKPAQSWMGVPMIVQGEPIGALMLEDLDREGAFTEDNLRFFTALANQVASVIHNVRLVEESRSRAVQLETAAEIARDISGSLNLDELLFKAVNFIRERFSFSHAAIFLLDLPGEFAVIREATGEAGAQMKRSGHKLGVGSKSIVGYVAGRGESLLVNDTVKDATYYPNPLLPETRAEAAIPLKVSERIVGVLDVQSSHPYAFAEENMRTLQILADQLAVAVVNSELFAETQEHLSQHRLLHHITTTAASGTTLEEALESAVTGLQVTLGGDRVSILLVDRDHKNLEVKATVGYSAEVNAAQVPIGSGVTGWVAVHRRPLRVDDVAQDSRYIQFSPNTRSELAIPLIYRNELLGVLNVESEQAAAYNENDEEMLGTLGGSLAAVVANARLLEQIRTQAERERLLYEVTSKIRRSTDIQSILSTTASELTKALGARQATITISPTEGKPPSGNGDGGMAQEEAE
jgi:GAF domain-containing protein/HAMP domain-containing protein